MQTEQFEIVVILEGIVETTGEYSDLKAYQAVSVVAVLPCSVSSFFLLHPIPKINYKGISVLSVASDYY